VLGRLLRRRLRRRVRNNRQAFPDLLIDGPRTTAGLDSWRCAALGLIPSHVLRRGNLDVANRLIAPDHVIHDVPSGRDLQGRTKFREYVNVLRGAFPDLSITIDAQAVDGDVVTTRYVAGGTFAGAFRDRRPTGARIEVRGVLVSRFRGPWIAEQWNDYDREAMRLQMRRPSTGS
jgi:predicted ester cyclase